MSNSLDKRRIYKNAPIIEASIILNFTFSHDVNLENLKEKLSVLLKEDYPRVDVLIKNEFRLECGNSPKSTSEVTFPGFRLSSEDGKKVIQFNKEGFNFSRLAPYEKWEFLCEETKEILEAYQSVACPETISKVGLRFINRFDLPGPIVNLSNYLKVFPQVPDFYNVNGFAMQVILDQPDIDSTLVISQALIPPSEPDVISLLLDFDLFSKRSRGFDSLEDFLELLHLKKNEIFESAITDKIREKIS